MYLITNSCCWKRDVLFISGLRCRKYNFIFNFDLRSKFNPLSRKSDWHQFSPNNTDTWSRENFQKLTKLTSKGKMLWSLNKISQLIFQGNVWRSVWRTHMRILDLKGKVFFGLRQEMDSETLAKLSTQMFLCKPSRERLLQRNGPGWAKERPSNVLWFIVLGTQQLYFSKLKIYDLFYY